MNTVAKVLNRPLREILLDPRLLANRLAEVSVHVPLTADVRGLVDALASDANEAYLADLGSDATIVLRRWVEM